MLRAFKNRKLLEAGIDEAGRGPLFGRVYAAAVILNPELEYNDKYIKAAISETKTVIVSAPEFNPIQYKVIKFEKKPNI